MNKQALRETRLFLQRKGNYMNRTSEMVSFFQEKMLLRKKVDYQEDYLLKMMNYTLFFKETPRKVQLIHIRKLFFLRIEDRTFSKRRSTWWSSSVPFRGRCSTWCSSSKTFRGRRSTWRSSITLFVAGAILAPQKHNHKDTTTPPHKHKIQPQKHNHRNITTPPQKHKNATSKTPPQKDNHATTKTRPHHHTSTTTPPQKHKHTTTRSFLCLNHLTQPQRV